MLLARRISWALIAVVSGGCGADRGPERVVVSGTVTHNGKPVSEGVIRFVPAPTCPVPTAGTTIVNGKYTVDSHGGVPVGTHGVQIEAFRKSTKRLRPEEQLQLPPNFPTDGLRHEQYLPAKYNTNTNLEITIPPGSRAITKNFDLTD